MDLVTDAHALLWHLFDPGRLGLAARQAFVAADQGSARIHVPALVVAEMIMVAEKRRIPGLTVAVLLPHVAAMARSSNYSLSSLAPETVIASHALSVVSDIFDRLIVAETLGRSLPLLTRDENIRASGLVRTVWD